MMKKLQFKHLLSLVTVILFLAGGGGGDLMGQTYRIGTGTNYSSSFPFSKNYSVTQQIYTRNDIFSSTTAGDEQFNHSQGGTIKELYFYNCAATDVTYDIDVYYKFTATDYFTNGWSQTPTWLDPESFDIIHSGNVTFKKEEWTGIGISPTISYNGKDNIAIMVVSKTKTSATTKFYCFTANSTNRQCCYCSNSETQIALNNLPVGQANTQINQIKFDFTPYTEDCSKPTSFAFSSVTDTGATLTWNAGNEETEWQIAISDNSSTDPEEIAENVTSRTKAYTGLNSNTTYYAWVRSYCDEDNQSDWVSTSFTTDCEIKTLSYSYGFEEASEFNCWSMKNAHNNTGITSGSTHSDSYKFQFYNSTSNSIQTLITPELNTSGKDGVRAEFYYKPNAPTSAILKVGYSTDSDDLGDFTWVDNEHNVEVSLASSSSSYWYCFTHDFQLSGIKYIAIQFDRNSSGNNVYIDDIQISEIPTRDLDYEYGFESLPEMGKWTMRYCNPTYTTRITTQKHSGDYGFEFRYNSSFSTQYLISPRLNNEKSGGTLFSYYTKQTDGNCGLQIGYSTTTLLDDDFTWIPNDDVITNETKGWERHEQLCPAGTKYICIKYVATDNTSLFLDDISIFAIDKVSNGEYWDYLADWNPAGPPSETDDVYINSDITIRDYAVSATIATANNIKIGPSGSLTIENGGELILSNSNTDVEATVKKTVAASTEKETTNNWYAISSPTHDDNKYYESFSNVSNLTPAAPDYLYNVYRYDEKTVVWQEHRDKDNEFNTMKKGRGYLFRSTKGGDLEYVGAVNTDTVKYNLSWSCPTEKFKGFNLIGNPYTHTIYKGAEGSAIPNGSILEDKYYTIGTNGRLTLTADGTAIAPGQAIFVQAKSASTLTMNNSTSGKVRDKYANDNIWFMVKNAESSDLACVEFRKGHGLNKVEHRNDITPMLYIMHNGENFASADMSDNTSVINLGFEAKTTGEYTFSLKARGTYSYMHLIDKITGADVDMLIEDSYSFVGSPRDRKDRFELRLNYNAANIDSESDIFAYQNGTDIIVRGEGELQVFDVTGRMAMKRQINGVQTVNGLNNGVYIFRLVGTEVKTQKIVVR